MTRADLTIMPAIPGSEGDVHDAAKVVHAMSGILRQFKATVRFRKRFCQFLISLGLAPALNHKLVDDHRGKVKEQNADGQPTVVLSRNLKLL